MAYGKIKADTLIYDNSGSDVEVTLSSLGNKVNAADPTFTGVVTIPTPSSGDNTTKAASTAFVVAGFAPKPASAGTVAASETVQVDANKDTTGIRNLTLSGNLTVNGTTTTVATTNTTLTDNLIELNSGASSNANDSGIIIERGSTGDNAIIAWDESADKFIVGTTTGTASSTGNITIATGTLVADVEGTATTATNVTVADESSDTSCNVLFATAATGNLPPKSGTNLTFNSSTGDLAATIITDGKGDVRSIPQISKAAGHTILASESGFHSINSTGGWTFNTSTAFTTGQAITLINNSGSNQTITNTGCTMYLAGDTATKSSLTLTGRGVATFICTASNVYYGSGAGLE